MSRGMNRISRLALCAMLAGAVAACGQEAGTNNQAAMPEDMTANGMAALNGPSNPYGPSEMQMHEAMIAAKGANVSDTWALKMIEHHRGAITMSEILLAQDPDSRFADDARAVIRDQTAEIRKLEAMLQPETASVTSQPASAAERIAAEPRSRPARAEPAAKAKAKATTPPPAADPHAGHDMGNMSNGM